MVRKSACHNSVIAENTGCQEKGPRQRLEEVLDAAREKAGRLDRRLGVKGDYGHGLADPTVVEWELNLARRRQLEKEIERLNAAVADHEAHVAELVAWGEKVRSSLPYRILFLP